MALTWIPFAAAILLLAGVAAVLLYTDSRHDDSVQSSWGSHTNAQSYSPSTDPRNGGGLTHVEGVEQYGEDELADAEDRLMDKHGDRFETDE